MITAVVLTKNASSTLERTLRSVTWCDEVIVVDDHSTDGTLAIAKKLGASVHVRALDNDFARQRNFGLSKAKGEWVLFVDADEVVPAALALEIQKRLKSNAHTGVQGFYMKRSDWFLGMWLRFGETASVRLLRLGRREAGKWVGSVHEIWKVHGTVDRLRTPLEHYPHPSLSYFLADINTYSTIRARELINQNVSVGMIHIIIYPLGKFIQNYILRLGFLDGMPGAVMAIMMSFHSFLVRAKAWRNTHP